MVLAFARKLSTIRSGSLFKIAPAERGEDAARLHFWRAISFVKLCAEGFGLDSEEAILICLRSAGEDARTTADLSPHRAQIARRGPRSGDRRYGFIHRGSAATVDDCWM